MESDVNVQKRTEDDRFIKFTLRTGVKVRDKIVGHEVQIEKVKSPIKFV